MSFANLSANALELTADKRGAAILDLEPKSLLALPNCSKEARWPPGASILLIIALSLLLWTALFLVVQQVLDL